MTTVTLFGAFLVAVVATFSAVLLGMLAKDMFADSLALKTWEDWAVWIGFAALFTLIALGLTALFWFTFATLVGIY